MSIIAIVGILFFYVGYRIGSTSVPASRILSRIDGKRICMDDSLKYIFKGDCSLDDIIKDKTQYPDSRNQNVPPQGYVDSPKKAMLIAQALITQHYNNPCALGIDIYRLYLCDDMWVVQCDFSTKKDSCITIQLDKKTGEILCMGKYHLDSQKKGRRFEPFS